jgi:hypothetical protein
MLICDTRFWKANVSVAYVTPMGVTAARNPAPTRARPKLLRCSEARQPDGSETTQYRMYKTIVARASRALR